ncbi:unnamed protein product, partial [Meganyctiphanes norvegica]
YLSSEVSAANVPEILNIATLLEDETLINKCAKVLEVSPDAFFLSPTIGSLNSDSLEQLLRQDLPVSSETVIFKGIMNWSRMNLKSKESEITTTSLRQEVNKYLCYVRFLTMSLEDFVRHVLPEKIFTFEEVESIQFNIAGVPEVNLPSLFSTSKENRNRFHKSQLDICRINSGQCTRNTRYYVTLSNPNILTCIQPKSIIYLSKLEYEGNIGYVGTLTVKDSSGLKFRDV